MNPKKLKKSKRIKWICDDMHCSLLDDEEYYYQITFFKKKKSNKRIILLTKNSKSTGKSSPLITSTPWKSKIESLQYDKKVSKKDIKNFGKKRKYKNQKQRIKLFVTLKKDENKCQ